MSPAPLSTFDPGRAGSIVGVFTDIDDTLTERGRLVPEAFAAMAALRQAGLRVVPVTGRPIGWVDCIARTWPVDAVVGENGGLWAWVDAQGRMHHRSVVPPEERATHRARLDALGDAILAAVPGAALASDQPFRALDLAVDWCEDVPRLPRAAVDRIVEVFRAAGATAKVSSIHVNGWFGAFDKASGCRALVQEVWGEALDPGRWAFVGDSANDEPLFALVHHGFGVANLVDFLDQMEARPRYLASQRGGHGFAEIVQTLLAARTLAPPARGPTTA